MYCQGLKSALRPSESTVQAPSVMSCHLADTFIQSDLQLIRLSNVGLRALLKGPTAVQTMATPGIEPLTLRVQVKYLNHYATGYPVGSEWKLNSGVSQSAFELAIVCLLAGVCLWLDERQGYAELANWTW